jgi:membrane-bound lytic murein transglycosylase D
MILLMATLRTSHPNPLALAGNLLMLLCLLFLGFGPALQAAAQPVPTLAPPVPPLSASVPRLATPAPAVSNLSEPALAPTAPHPTDAAPAVPPLNHTSKAIHPIVLREAVVPALASTASAVPHLAAPHADAPGQQVPQQPTPASDSVATTSPQQDLIARAEASYRSGVANYNANKLDAARADFDAAVDAMLSSGLDLKNDPQLADEFDHLLSAINSLELLALKQGNGFSPVLEAAPADAAAEVTFAPDPVLVTKVTAELKTTVSDLPLVINDYVAGWINAFTNKPTLHEHLVRSIERAGKYKDMIQRVLREQGVPQDLIYQAVTESGFQPQALNRSSGAGGMWQFMPQGGYGLARNGYFDERFDPEKSTIAYAKYMKVLYNLFGDWYLAMAAYDWGPGRVQHVVSRTGYADYWEIYRHGNLPAETKAYIPSVIAAIIMARNPEQYGLTDLHPDAPVLSDTVTTSYAIDMRLVADLTESTVQEIVALNPALLRLTTPRDITYDLHVPPGTRDVFLERVKEIPEDDRASWRFHIVKSGETLDQIALNLHAHSSEIAKANDITPAKPIQADDELVIPIAAASNDGELRYTLRRSDTLVTVADRFGVSVEQLRTWNHLASTRVIPGRSLYVTEPIRLAPGTGSVRGRHSRRGSHSRSSATKKRRTSHR